MKNSQSYNTEICINMNSNSYYLINEYSFQNKINSIGKSIEFLSLIGLETILKNMFNQYKLSERFVDIEDKNGKVIGKALKNKKYYTAFNDFPKYGTTYIFAKITNLNNEYHSSKLILKCNSDNTFEDLYGNAVSKNSIEWWMYIDFEE